MLDGVHSLLLLLIYWEHSSVMFDLVKSVTLAFGIFIVLVNFIILGIHLFVDIIVNIIVEMFVEIPFFWISS